MSDQGVLAALERIGRRILLAVGRGRITTVNDGGSVQKVQLQLGALEVRDNTPRLAEYGFTSNPPAGSDAVVLFVGGDRSNGVMIATGNQTYRLTGLASGEVAIHDDLGRRIWLKASEIQIDANNSPVSVDNATTVTINAATKVRAVTPRFEVTGDIIDNCDTQPRTMATMRSIYDTHTHPVPNVQGGSSTVTTNVPNQQE